MVTKETSTSGCRSGHRHHEHCLGTPHGGRVPLRQVGCVMRSLTSTREPSECSSCPGSTSSTKARNGIIVVGDAAMEMANVFGREARRPLSQGLISAGEMDALDVLGSDDQERPR